MRTWLSQAYLKLEVVSFSIKSSLAPPKKIPSGCSLDPKITLRTVVTNLSCFIQTHSSPETGPSSLLPWGTCTVMLRYLSEASCSEKPWTAFSVSTPHTSLCTFDPFHYSSWVTGLLVLSLTPGSPSVLITRAHLRHDSENSMRNTEKPNTVT